jgi:hypothetical protein
MRTRGWEGNVKCEGTPSSIRTGTSTTLINREHEAFSRVRRTYLALIFILLTVQDSFEDSDISGTGIRYVQTGLLAKVIRDDG